MSSLTLNQSIAKDLVDYHQAEGWLSTVGERPLQALYLTLKALEVDTTVMIASFACFVKSHDREYIFFDGAVQVDGVLLDLNGCVGADEIETRRRTAVAKNQDLLWRGGVAWKPIQDGSYEVYKRNYDSDPTPAQYQQIIDKGVARAQAFQLKNQRARLPSSASLSRARL